jgi:VCBS repeat-containing protein
VTVTVTGLNDPPTAVDDGIPAQEGQTLSDLQVQLLANDSDPDLGDSISIAAAGPATTGTVSLVAGALTYTASGFDWLAQGVTATDVFTYAVRDALGAESTATVTVTVTGLNDPPTAVDDPVAVQEDEVRDTLQDVLLANDLDPDVGDPKRIIAVGTAITGVVSLDAGGNLTYTASGFDALPQGATATDVFTYTMADLDGAGVRSTARVTVTVTGVNDPPTANNDSISLDEDASTVSLQDLLLANDTDLDVGDIKRIVRAGTPITGALNLDAGGNVTYTASGFDWLPQGVTANDAFTYTMADGVGAEATATVSVVVTGTDDPPVADFSYRCSALTCAFTGTLSLDPDGTIVAYAWDYGDGSPTGSGGIVTHGYAMSNTYGVTLTVTSSDGGGDSQTQSVVAHDAMHIGDLDGILSGGGGWTAVVTATVHNGLHNAVAGATVTGTWGGDASGSGSCGSPTDASGQCTITIGMNGNKTVTFTVTNVTHSTLPYDPAANHDPDGDSNGTVIPFP